MMKSTDLSALHDEAHARKNQHHLQKNAAIMLIKRQSRLSTNNARLPTNNANARAAVQRDQSTQNSKIYIVFKQHWLI